MTFSQLKGTRFLALVIVLYAVLFFIDRDTTKAAFWQSASVLFKLLPVFLTVIVLSGLINYFLNPKQIVKHFGKESGVRGWLYALVAGVISHGPMYAWYPMLQEMRSHGMRDALIAVFFYSRAIKLPLLPLMIDYFGLLYTTVLSVYILLAALLQGKMIECCSKGEEHGDRY